MTTESDLGKLYLQGDITFDHDHPISDGGYGELFAGSHKKDGRVALKRLKIHGTGDERPRYLMDTMAEAKVWRELVHPNVLTFLGLLFEGRDVYLVSPLVEEGSLPRYLSGHPDADRSVLLRDVAEGLSYLHSQRVIHGDVKGTNILVQSGSRAALCDFGLSKILVTSVSTTRGGLGTFRWQSPELMEGGARSFEGDVYAYGMTIYETISGQIPFHEYSTDSAVMIAVILRGERPSLDALLVDNYARFWNMARRCWAELPRDRPSMAEVSESFILSSPCPLEESLQALNLISSVEDLRDRLCGGDDNVQAQGEGRHTTNPANAREIEGHTNSVLSIAFSPDGSRLVSGSGDQTVRLWNVSSCVAEMILKGHTGKVRSVTFSPDGSLVASGSADKTVRLWNVINGNPDEGGKSWLWNRMSGAGVVTLRGHTDWIRSVAVSPDGSQIASGSDDRTVRLWNVISKSKIATLQGHTFPVMSVVFSPDGSRLASGSVDWTAQLWDVASGGMLITLKGHSDCINSVTFSPDGLRLAAGSDDRTIRMWDVSSGQEVSTLQGHTGGVNSISFSSDGSRIASGSDDETVRLWDVSSGAEVAKLQGHRNLVRSISFSPDGSLLASGSHDRTIRLWQCE